MTEENNPVSPVWIARLKLEQAGLERDEIDKNADRLKTRLATCLTISVSIVSALSVYAFGKTGYILSFLVLISGFFWVSVCCLLGLNTNKWDSAGLSEEQIALLTDKQNCELEADIFEEMAKFSYKKNENNSETLVIMRRYLKRAYLCFLITPLVSVLLFFMWIIFRPLLWQAVHNNTAPRLACLVQQLIC